MIADVFLPDHLRYNERARAVCLRFGDLIDVLAPQTVGAPETVADMNHVNPSLTAGLVRPEA